MCPLFRYVAFTCKRCLNEGLSSGSLDMMLMKFTVFMGCTYFFTWLYVELCIHSRIWLVNRSHHGSANSNRLKWGRHKSSVLSLWLAAIIRQLWGPSCTVLLPDTGWDKTAPWRGNTGFWAMAPIIQSSLHSTVTYTTVQLPGKQTCFRHSHKVGSPEPSSLCKR